MNTRSIMLAILFVGIASSVLTYVVYFNYIIYDVAEFRMDATVVEKNRMGFNVENDSVHFGSVPLGATGKRTLMVDNPAGEPLTMDIKTYGNISGWVSVSANGFLLEPGEVREIQIICDVPDGAEKGYYSGSLQIVYMRVGG